jgi:hypothetical protein
VTAYLDIVDISCSVVGFVVGHVQQATAGDAGWRLVGYV